MNSPDSHIEDVAAHRRRDGHVPEPLPGHDDAGDEVRDGGAGCQEGEAHHLGRDADGVAGDGCPPDHQVGEGGYPQYAAQECYREKLASWNKTSPSSPARLDIKFYNVSENRTTLWLLSSKQLIIQTNSVLSIAFYSCFTQFRSSKDFPLCC